MTEMEREYKYNQEGEVRKNKYTRSVSGGGGEGEKRTDMTTIINAGRHTAQHLVIHNKFRRT